MSRSRASMNSFQNELSQRRIDFGTDAHRNQVASAEVAAFYRILFGHQHEITIGELEVCGSKRVVIRKRMGREREAHARKPREKPLGIADSGDRVQLLPEKPGLHNRAPMRTTSEQPRRCEPTLYRFVPHSASSSP